MRRAARALRPNEIRSREIRELIQQMKETMYAAPGVGLAAPQIGQGIQLAVIEDRWSTSRTGRRSNWPSASGMWCHST